MAEPKHSAEFEQAVLDRLDRLDRLLTEHVKRKKGVARAGGKRARTVAERVAAGVRYRPTELEMAAARRKLRAG